MSDNDNINNYKETVKATSLFGGVELFNILIRIIRGKFIAVLLGPAGMGIVGLLNSTTELLSAFTNFGLQTSAVRNIAEANATGNSKQVFLVLSVLRKLVWYTGLFGTLICLFGASYFSQLTFGNSDYTYAFIILSVNILLVQLTHGQIALLQGLQKYKYLAKANIVGNTIGLFITVPLYYFWGIDAIIPVLLLTNVTTFILAIYYARKVNIKKVSVNLTDLKVVGGDMIKMGILISMSGLLATLSSYLVRIFISQTGGIDEVGLYNAGFTIINTYIGLVLTAMGTDYYPRLSKAASEKSFFLKTINEQAEIAILLIGPLVIAFIIFIKLIIFLLFSSKFLPIETMLLWAMSATLFKTMAWTLSYSLLAKGDSKVFFWSELSVLIYGFALNIGGYYYYGLSGLGVSFFIMYILYFVQLLFIVKIRYAFSFNSMAWRFFIIMGVFLLFAVIVKFFMPNWIGYSIGTLLFLYLLRYSFMELDKRIGIKQLIINMIKRQ